MTSPAIAAESSSTAEPFGYCFNTSTIRGQNLPLETTVEIVAQAGYRGLEPWIREIQVYQRNGGSLPDLRKKIADLGLTVESAIGFAPWIVDDDAARARGLEQAKVEMDLVAKIGGTRIAAPPAGATDQSDLDLFAAAERYAALLRAGEEIGVVPQAEVWGFSKSLSRLGETAFVVIESGHKNACLLPDVYHIYKGGSSFVGLAALSGTAIHVFHVNDYPADPPRATIEDKYRVYPGDGTAPLKEIFTTLRTIGFQGMLSLELFNPAYWEQDPLEVARTGLEKTKAAVASALA
jgi:sugar phosphate isomerase/epimerase